MTHMARSRAGHSILEDQQEDSWPPWCQDLLKDSSYEHIGKTTRTHGGPRGPSFNILIGKTLFTNHTIRAMKLLYKAPSSTKPMAGSSDQHQEGKTTSGELTALISLGDEMCSHTNVLHGGINTTIIDEVGGALAAREVPVDMMAVNFNVNLRKSVKTPGIILVRAWMEKPPQGRKIWVHCRTEQDGQTCIESESLYLEVDMGSKL